MKCIPEHKCIICFKVFAIKRRLKYCSDKCSRIAVINRDRSKPIPERKCILCSKIFIIKGRPKYCSDDCYSESIRISSKKRQDEGKTNEWRLKNKDDYLNYQHNYYSENKEQILLKAGVRVKERRKIDISFKLRYNLRSRVGAALKHGYKKTKALELIGCSIEQFKQHIESQFQPGMNWGNWGRGEDKWHIDHIIPVCNFNLIDIVQQKKAFHYTNQQPLWAHDNLSKPKFVNMNEQPICILN